MMAGFTRNSVKKLVLTELVAQSLPETRPCATPSHPLATAASPGLDTKKEFEALDASRL
jgi:hypothetical protein